MLAVWLQLVLSYGHMHPEDLFATARAPLVQHRGGDLVAAERPDPHRTAPAAPQSGDDRDGCAICAAMQLAATGLLPAPVVLPGPLGRLAAPEDDAERPLRPPTPFRLFQPRAPPLA